MINTLIYSSACKYLKSKFLLTMAEIKIFIFFFLISTTNLSPRVKSRNEAKPETIIVGTQGTKLLLSEMFDTLHSKLSPYHVKSKVHLDIFSLKRIHMVFAATVYNCDKLLKNNGVDAG